MPDTKRTALVLSGGGLRGGAHVGALKVFERVGLLKAVSVVAGTSAGSIVGAMLASGASVTAIEEAILRLMTTPCHEILDVNTGAMRDVACAQDLARFSGFLIGQAMLDLVEKNAVHIRRFAEYATLPPELQDKVKDLLLVAVNLDTGLKTVFCDPARYTSYDEGVLCGKISFAQAARASSSAPVIVTPFACPEGCSCGQEQRGGKGTPQFFVDGAVRENCPIKLVVKLAGCTRILAVNLGYAGDRVEGVASQGMAEILSQSMAVTGAQQFDADLSYLRVQVAEGDIHLSAYVLNPRLYDMGTFDFNRLDEAISRGEQAATWFIETINSQTPIMNPDGTVDPERLFARQGVFEMDYPDPEREERRSRLMIALTRPRQQQGKTCRVEKELTQTGLLALAAVVSVSLALFTIGGAVALRLKPGAASLSDLFVFWDGGVIAFLAGWLIMWWVFKLWLCRSR